MIKPAASKSNENELLERISKNSLICHGKPTIKGHRIMVYQVLELIESGYSFEQIVRDYFPTIKIADVRACVHYASHMIRNVQSRS